MSTTRLFLIRHGTTNLSAEDRFSGGTDVDLSEEGRYADQPPYSSNRLSNWFDGKK